MFKARKQYSRSIIAALVLVLGLLTPTTTPQAQSGGNPGVIPPNARPYGMSYAQWSAKFGQWGLALPVEGHPFFVCPEQPDTSQAGPVWFLAGGPTECGALSPLMVPTGKSLFFPLVNAECSNLETGGGFAEGGFHGDTAAEQKRCAQLWADHIVVASLFCEVDGVPVQNPARYRFVSPQYAFTAPTPWVFGEVGGAGTSVADGYSLMLAPLSRGAHTIHFGGAFHLSVADGDPFDADFGIDTTHHLTVGP